MTRGCAICQRSPAKKSICCGQKLCEPCVDSHSCPRAAELLAMTKGEAKAFLSVEDSLTNAVVDALNHLSGVTVWQSKKRGGVRASDPKGRSGVADVIGFAAPDATFIAVETKHDHKPECGCDPCERQRDFGARLVGAGGVYVPDVRNVAQAVDGVRMGLARRRAGRSIAS